MPTYCRYCHAEGHAVPDCPKKRSSRVCWNCRTSDHIAAECAKSKNKPFKKARKTPNAPQNRVAQGEVQSSQVSNGIAMPSTSPPPTSHFEYYETILSWYPTQEVLKALFTTIADSREDIQMETNTGSIDDSHVVTDEATMDQAIKNIPQSRHQAAMDSHHNDAPTGYNFRHDSLDNLGLPIPECIPERSAARHHRVQH
ncbi:hypothetical protein G6F24_014902 [Rhizopus arrhizus]|nr:hypothetical protein G6F24_014902 [Rhizopus arrhizus]